MLNILFFNIIVLATAFSPFIGNGNINYLVVGVMLFSVSITAKHLLSLLKYNSAIYILPVTMFMSGIYNINSFRFSSYAYGLLFILFFISNQYLIRSSKITIRQYKDLIKKLLYAFFFVLIIQQLMFIFGVANFFNKISSEGYKFNSLATEPSYAAAVVVILFYSYIFICKIQLNTKYRLSNFRNDKYIWFVFAYLLLTLGSSFGILFFILLLISFVGRPRYFVSIFSLILIGLFFGYVFQIESLRRLVAVVNVVIFNINDYSRLIEVDHSASIRIIPLIMAVSSLDFFIFFGKGVDFSANYFPTVIAGISEGGFQGGLLPSFVIDYGLINAIILMVIFKQYLPKKIFSFELLLLLIIVLNTSFNSQLFWFVLTFISINSHFRKMLFSNRASAINLNSKDQKIYNNKTQIFNDGK